MTYNKTSYELENEIMDETDIGPEVTHIYQVFTEIAFQKNKSSLIRLRIEAPVT